MGTKNLAVTKPQQLPSNWHAFLICHKWSVTITISRHKGVQLMFLCPGLKQPNRRRGDGFGINGDEALGPAQGHDLCSIKTEDIDQNITSDRAVLINAKAKTFQSALWQQRAVTRKSPRQSADRLSHTAKEGRGEERLQLRPMPRWLPHLAYQSRHLVDRT